MFLLVFQDESSLAIPWVSKHVPSNKICVQPTLVTCQKKTTIQTTIPTNHSSAATTSTSRPLFFFLVPFISECGSSSRRLFVLHGQGSSNDADDGTPNCHSAGITADFYQLLAKLFLWYPQAPITNSRKYPKVILTSWVYLQEMVLDHIFMISAKSSSHCSPPQKKNTWKSFQPESACEQPPKQVSWHVVSKISPTFIWDLLI